MSKSVVVTRPAEVETVPKDGITLGAIGALMIVIEGIYALITKSVFVPALGGPVVAAYALMVLGLGSILAMYMSEDFPFRISYVIGTAAILSLLFGGGFYYVGAIVAFAGAVLLHYRR